MSAISPDHYRTPGPEVIELTRHMTYSLGNAVKYAVRAGKKDETKTVEDLTKAIWYLLDEIGRIDEPSFKKTEALKVAIEGLK